jgi:anaerobic dimethyl sulfoxide reductase subunit A
MNKTLAQSILRRWRRCHDFVLFFADFPRWQKDHPPVPAAQELLREYDDLFKGTNASIYIPLWASACMDREDIIWDETTLEAIKTYHRWGYEPADMDGNPPDFIGQQFRFFCYLSAAALHELEQGKSADSHEGAVKHFTETFLAATAGALARGLRQHSSRPLFLAAADQLEDFIREQPGGPAGNLPPPPDGGEAPGEASLFSLPELPLPELSCYAVYQKGPLPPLPDRAERVLNTTCTNNCGGRCVLRIREQEGCILEVSTDAGLGGAPGLRACVRGRAYRETYMSGRRLRYPMKRAGERGEGRFRRISWEEAADIAAAEWRRIRDAWGPSARYVNYSRGIVAALRPDAQVTRLLNLDGGHLAWYNTYSSACLAFTMPYIYGDNVTGNSLEDTLNAKLIVLWGHNPNETIFGTERNYYMTRAKEKGIPIIVIDPRQSDTVIASADWWIPIRPSSDPALANALAWVIWSEGLQDQHFMDTYCLGFDEEHMPEGIPPHESYKAFLFGEKDGINKTPEWAEAITGVPAETTRRLARLYAGAKPACLMQGNGPQRTACGEQTVRAICALTCLTGNVGIPGGSAGGTGGRGLFAYHLGFPIPPSPFPGSIPSFTWTRAVEKGTEMTPEEDGLVGVKKLDVNIKLIFNFAGNTLINQHSDVNNTVRILKNTELCEFILGSDVLMTPSARFADILLPGASSLEQENIAQPWGNGQYLLYNAKIREPVFGSRFEYFFLEELARRIGLFEAWSEGHADPAGWLETLYANFRKEKPELPEFEVFKREGGYYFKNAKTHIAYADQIRDPVKNPFKTPSGKIEIFSRRIYDLRRPHEILGIPGYTPPPEGPQDPLREKYPLQLIGYHTKKRTHSTHDANPWLDAMDPQRLWIHPADAETRSLRDGDLAEIFNDRGRVRIPVFVTPRIIRGVVALSQGAWYTPDSSGTDIRGCINVLTSIKPTPFARGNPQHTNLVEVKKYG